MYVGPGAAQPMKNGVKVSAENKARLNMNIPMSNVVVRYEFVATWR